ncbi:hypothetical protein NBRC10512_006212 [Rhodotorula toruloides]|uniref:MFS transporter, glucose transporter n=1 Tax=Rhodotorula toruloides (strain NP11) TaxID=1130832 RepID=M7WQN4_RHOT1|nr:MFS transporter, glucose transporter [Rhodotorula toruloides NP11]EMS22842.1 MFS transporter, glucose transporter [Rhodotorula toruloides NP11]
MCVLFRWTSLLVKPYPCPFDIGCDLISMSGQVSNPAYLEQFNHPNSNLQGALLWRRSHQLIINGWVWVLGCIIQAASFNVRTLVAGCVVAGLAVGLGSAIVTIYQAEITRPAIRGRIVATQQLAITFSELLQYFVSFGCSYIANSASFRMRWALQAIPGLILGILMFAFPESPRWLMDHGREGQALQILADVYAKGDTENELVQLDALRQVMRSSMTMLPQRHC